MSLKELKSLKLRCEKLVEDKKFLDERNYKLFIENKEWKEKIENVKNKIKDLESNDWPRVNIKRCKLRVIYEERICDFCKEYMVGEECFYFCNCCDRIDKI